MIRTAAGRALLEREALNSRSFTLIRPEDIAAIEAEAAWHATLAALAAPSTGDWRGHLDAIRRQLVGSPPNVDSIDAAIGSAINDCEAAIDAAIEAEGTPHGAK